MMQFLQPIIQNFKCLMVNSVIHKKGTYSPEIDSRETEREEGEERGRENRGKRKGEEEKGEKVSNLSLVIIGYRMIYL